MIKSNKHITIKLDQDKSYVYIKDKDKDIGFLCWDYTKKRWKFFVI